MEHFKGIVLLGTVGLTLLLPYMITFIISADAAYIRKNQRTYRKIMGMVLGTGMLCDSAVVLLGHRMLFGKWNILKTVKKIYDCSFFYHDVRDYALLLLFCAICAGVIGAGIRWIFPRLSRIAYGRGFLTVRKRVLLFMTGILVCVIVIVAMLCGMNGSSHIVINEVGPYNVSRGVGEEATICDYVELYNKGLFNVYEERLFLSDDENNLTKWNIPEFAVSSHGYVDIAVDAAELAISRKGNETVYLSDAQGHILDQVTVPAVSANVSYSRMTDAGEIWGLVTQTPGQNNSFARRLHDVRVQLSHEGGFYPDAFYLSMSAEEGYEIYYTLDGSIPDETAIRYTEPIYVYDKSPEPNVFRSLQRVVYDWKNYTPDTEPVDKGFIIRARAIAEDGAVGDTVEATYFIGMEQYQDKGVVSLIADPEELFGEDGIYVTGKAYDERYLSEGKMDTKLANFVQKGRSSEIAAHMEYYAMNDSPLRQKIGLRISGNSARENAIKRFGIYSRTGYSGSETFATELFDGVSTRRVQLRAGYMNSLSQILAEDRAVAIQRSIPVSVFVNGEYWQHSYILEKYDERYFQERYGINENELLLKKHYYAPNDNPENAKYFDIVYEYLEKYDLQDPQAYAGFGELVDIQSYIDFMCTNIYVNNIDFSETKNIIWWRSRNTGSGCYADGKWRLALYDMDAADFYTADERVKINMFTADMPWAESMSEYVIYNELKKKPDFCRQFVVSFMDMVNHNFAYEKVAQTLNIYEPDEADEGIHYFFRERAKYIVPCMAEEFGLTGTLETITLGKNNSGGKVMLNTIVPDLTEGSWSGQYYTDYPVEVTAIPEPGYRFAGWTGDISAADPTQEIVLPRGGIEIHAIFEKE